MSHAIKRHCCQGVWSVLRFNWHLHLIALVVIIVFVSAAIFLTGLASFLFATLAFGAVCSLLLSIVATWVAYDASGLYQLHWLVPFVENAKFATNIHAGFDEISPLLRRRSAKATWKIFDFYQAEKHTEISIQRARKAHPPSPDTIPISTENMPLDDRSMDCAVLFLAAHEIRDHQERVTFFRELKRVLTLHGKIIVTEHMRDVANIAAYSVGAWHFHSKAEWLSTFREAGLHVSQEYRNNLFITTFVVVADEYTH